MSVSNNKDSGTFLMTNFILMLKAMPVRLVAICVYYVSVWVCTWCNDSFIVSWPLETQWTVSVMSYVLKCLFSGAILPFISPLTKYTAMLNAAVPYNYPGKHWRSLCHSRFEFNWKLTFQRPKTPTLFSLHSSRARWWKHAWHSRSSMWTKRKKLGLAQKSITSDFLMLISVWIVASDVCVQQ